MPTNDEIKAMVEYLKYLGDHASFEPSAHHKAAAMLRELLAERKWLDMDSAPMDGTEILIWCQFSEDGWCAKIGHFEGDGEGGGLWVRHASPSCYTFSDEDDMDCDPAKWLPLPTPETSE